MILDAQQQLCDSQALTGSAISENVIDLAQDRSIGSGEPMAILVNVEVAADQTTGDEDYTFDAEIASDAAMTTARQTLGRRIFESGTPGAPAQDADLLVAGFWFAIPIPPTKALAESERYLGLRNTLAGTTPSITISAWLVPQSFIQDDKYFADGFTIS